MQSCITFTVASGFRQAFEILHLYIYEELLFVLVQCPCRSRYRCQSGEYLEGCWLSCLGLFFWRMLQAWQSFQKVSKLLFKADALPYTSMLACCGLVPADVMHSPLPLNLQRTFTFFLLHSVQFLFVISSTLIKFISIHYSSTLDIYFITA